MSSSKDASIHVPAPPASSSGSTDASNPSPRVAATYRARGDLASRRRSRRASASTVAASADLRLAAARSDSALAFAALVAAVPYRAGDGVNWVGEAPFSTREHMFQNLGDGTYFHSGVLAIRAAVAAGVLAMVSPGVPEAIVVILVVASGVSGFSWNGLYHAAGASNAKPDQLGEVIGGSYGFVFLGSLAGPGISALLYGLSGSYVVVFMYVGLMALFGAISVVPLRNRKASVDEPKNT